MEKSCSYGRRKKGNERKNEAGHGGASWSSQHSEGDMGGLGLHDHLGYVMNLRLDWSTWDSPLNPNQPEQNKKENMKSILEDFR